MFPPKCGNWIHIPQDLPREDGGWSVLVSLGVRIGRECKRHGPIWQHMHLPPGWSYSVSDQGVAILRDQKNRDRAFIVASSIAEDTTACMIVKRYFAVATGSYQEDGLGFMILELRDPEDTTVYHVFERVSLNVAFNLVPLVARLRSMAKVLYPDLENPLAYWN